MMRIMIGSGMIILTFQTGINAMRTRSSLCPLAFSIFQESLMVFAALVPLVTYTVVWITLSIFFYTFIYVSLVLHYVFIWDEGTRKSVCPNGLLSAIFFDE